MKARVSAHSVGAALANPISLRTRLLVLAALAALSTAVPVAMAQVSPGEAETPPTVPASDCPDANAGLKQSGLPVPDQYSPSCPSPAKVKAEIAEVTRPTPPPVLVEAVKQGVIHEDQDPSTYPEAVQRGIAQWQADHAELGK